MYVEHPYKFNDKFYAKVDGKFYEITREVAKAMLSAYRNEIWDAVDLVRIMLNTIQDRFREGTVIASQLIVPAIAIILRAKDGG